MFFGISAKTFVFISFNADKASDSEPMPNRMKFILEIIIIIGG